MCMLPRLADAAVNVLDGSRRFRSCAGFLSGVSARVPRFERSHGRFGQSKLGGLLRYQEWLRIEDEAYEAGGCCSSVSHETMMGLSNTKKGLRHGMGRNDVGRTISDLAGIWLFFDLYAIATYRSRGDGNARCNVALHLDSESCEGGSRA